VEAVKNLALQLEERAREVQKELEASIQSTRFEKERWEAEKLEMSKMYQINDNIVDLNVGGTLYTTYRSVLCKHEGSMLEAMFSGRHPFAKDSAGRYFLDCDGEAFGYVLNFLRRGQMIWPDSASMSKRVSLELNFFGISFPLFEDSSIFTKQPELRTPLVSLFTGLSETKLLYKASVDGWTSQSFHQKVNTHANTLTIIQVGTYVFGGFSPLTWNSVTDGAYAPAHSSSFLFSLSNPSKSYVGVKLPNTGTSSKYSIYKANDRCATFGGGHDILVYQNATANNTSYTNLGHSYSHPTFQYNSTEAKTFFCGSYNFTPSEVEVFALTLTT